jgi:hypothetical protein
MSPEEIKQWINFKGKGWYEIENKKFYYSLYGEPDRGEPALNFKNPEVKKYMLSVADYWLKIGVDGFRGDAAKYLYFNGPGKELQEHQPETFEFWRDLKKIMLNYSKDKVLIAEIIPNPVEYDYTGKNRELFDFLYNNNFSESLYDRGVNFRTVTSAKYNSSFKNQNNIHSLIYHSNHDIERIASKLNPEKDKNIELKLVASMLLLSNSTPMLYFGDEIGLAYGDGERNYSALSTMAFDNNKNFGFSTADKIIPPTTVNSQTNNVEIQEKQEDSLLNYSRELIALRHKYNVFANGFMQKHEQIDEKIYSYTLYNNNVSILILHNLSPIDKNIEFDLNKINIKKEYQLTKIFGDYLDNYHIENKKLYIKNFKPYGSLVFKLEGITKTDFDIINPDFENSFLLNFDKKYSTKNQVYKLPTSSEKISITLKIKKPIIIHCYDKKQIQTNIFTIKPNKKNDIIIPFSVDTVFFKIEEQNIHFTINNLDIFDYFEKRTRETIRHNENKTLKSLAYGMDENFWYFKIEKEKFIMPKNSGLDFCMFIHDPNNETGVKEIGFWLLHGIHSKEIINNLLIYQKGLKNDKPILFTNTTQSTQPGINKEEAVIFQETNNALYLAIDKKNMPMNNYKIGLCVWSASGEWGDRAMTQEPIAEMLPYNEEEMKKQYPYHIDLIEIKG